MTSFAVVNGAVRPRINEHGLFVHRGAGEAIRAHVLAGMVDRYPVYLVGLVLPPHRCGPALVALLALPDGGVLHVAARTLSGRERTVDWLEGDVDCVDAGALEQHRSAFFEKLGGFSAPCLQASPTAAAEDMLRSAWLGVALGPEVGPSTDGPPRFFPSDWTDEVFYSQRGIGCAVEGFAPGVDLIDPLDIPDALKRAMQLAPSAGLSWLGLLGPRITADIHPRIVEMVAEAWAIRLLSPHASVVLLRSVAELVAVRLGAPERESLFQKIESVEDRWDAECSDRSPAGRRERARREAILACFQTTRDLGNRIHADSVITAEEVTLAHEANRRLLEATLGHGPLDAGGLV